MHSIVMGIVVQKRCARRRPVRLRSTVEECAVHTALRSNDSESERSITTWVPASARHPGRGFPRALRGTAYATAIITSASHEANAPILTPDIPAMIAAATMALVATQTPQRRSALR